MNENQLWNKFLEEIKDKMSPISFETWFKDTYLYKIENNKAIVIVPMQLHKKNLKENYKDLISEIFNSITGTNFEFEFLMEDEIKKNEPVHTIEQGVPYNNPEQANLKPNYTFENFVVGTSNRFAYTAAVAVAENPGKAYNPLFLYGSSGLGKTHLMQAIGHKIIKESNKKVLYVPSEKFKSDFISINRKSDNNFENIDYFKKKYRDLDVLIIDDIQFLSTATQTQQEFFHTFNELHEEGKQIIISSDRSPEDLKLLEERLRTRFSWGLSVNIYPPDYDLRMQILKKKLSLYELARPIDEEVLEFIANNCTADVRKLEGALNRLFAYSTMLNISHINLDVATEALKGQLNTCGYIKNNIQKIQTIVADYYNITTEDLKSKKRTAKVAYPRQIAMYLSRVSTDESLTRIGLEFGGKDHTTIMHAIDKISKDMKEDKNLEIVINNLKSKIG